MRKRTEKKRHRHTDQSTSIVQQPDMGDLKQVFDAYAAYGGKGSAPKFESRDFVKFCKDAGLIIEKGNKFNMKPPNRVDFVFTYACTNGEGGKKGNKVMNFAQFKFALRGVAKETGRDISEVESKAAAAKPSTNATEASATRFHDDKSNYTGAYRALHGGDMVDKLTARFNRKQGTMTPAQLKDSLAVTARVKAEFVNYDEDGSGFLDKEETCNALSTLVPTAKKDAIEMVYGILMAYGDKNGDGLLDCAEFVNAYNKLTDLLKLMGTGNVVPDDKALIKSKYLMFSTYGGAGEEMDGQRFKMLCQQVFPKAFPKNQDGSTACDLIFTDALRMRREKEKNSTPVKASKITFEQFFGYAIMSMAEKCGNTVPDVIMKLINCEAVEGKSTKVDDTSDRFVKASTGNEKKKADAAGW
jgi:hypothetical protein